MLCSRGQGMQGRQGLWVFPLGGSLRQVGFRFFFREHCPCSALLVGPEGGAEMAVVGCSQNTQG